MRRWGLVLLSLVAVAKAQFVAAQSPCSDASEQRCAWPLVPHDHWSIDAGRRLRQLGLMPQGFDAAASARDFGEMLTAFQFADSIAAGSSRELIARTQLERLRSELSRSQAETGLLRLGVGGGIVVHENPAVFRNVPLTFPPSERDPPDTASAALSLTAGGRVLGRVAFSWDAIATANALNVRQATISWASPLNLTLWAGRATARYATAESGGMLLSGAVPLDGAGFAISRPRRLPGFLKVLGPVDFEGMALKTHALEPYNYRSWIWSARGSIQPSTYAGLGVTRTGMFAALDEDADLTARDIFNSLAGRNRIRFTNPGYTDNQAIAVNAWARSPFESLPLSAYVEWGADDTAGAWRDVPGRTGGITVPAWPGVPQLSLGIERTVFEHSCCGNGPWMRHHEIPEGWSDRGTLLGHPLGGTGRQTVVYAGWLSRDFQVGIQGGRGVRSTENGLAPERSGRFSSLRINGHWRMSTRMALRIDVEREDRPNAAGSNRASASVDVHPLW